MKFAVLYNLLFFIFIYTLNYTYLFLWSRMVQTAFVDMENMFTLLETEPEVKYYFHYIFK